MEVAAFNGPTAAVDPETLCVRVLPAEDAGSAACVERGGPYTMVAPLLMLVLVLVLVLIPKAKAKAGDGDGVWDGT